MLVCSIEGPVSAFEIFNPFDHYQSTLESKDHISHPA
jgi:hypothetical protein